MGDGVKKRIICLYGGPCSGKSTICAGLFYQLKLAGHNVEMNREYVKEWCWEKRTIHPGDQTYFFAKQAHKERIYMRQGMDYIITDSPLILTHFYGLQNDPFEVGHNTSLQMLEQHAAICRHYGYKVDHYFVKRNKPYEQAGRFESEETAELYDDTIRIMLMDLDIQYIMVESLEDILNRGQYE